ncbi:hypothetical protein [Kroppenstedtia eburnea]
MMMVGIVAVVKMVLVVMMLVMMVFVVPIRVIMIGVVMIRVVMVPFATFFITVVIGVRAITSRVMRVGHMWIEGHRMKHFLLDSSLRFY